MATNILASVSVVLGAEISEFRAKMAEARKELSGLIKFSDGAKDIGENMSKFITLPLLALGAGVAKVGADFESAFNRVEAATQATGAELLGLKEKAKGIALDPKLKFSATEAAQALENLAKNGLSSGQILNGAADATVNLATATGGQLATSADIATDVMNNFNLTAAQLAASVDNITGTTIASKLDIDNYRQALGQAGSVAGQLGVNFGDFNTALAVTSSGFSSGSDAGTSFKTFLQRLVPQSKEAEGAMKQLGLKFFDAQGQMKPLREIAGELQQAFKGLSDEQKTNLGTKIFGSDSIRTALLLAKDGAEGFDKMAASIGKVNAAAQGAILSKGFAGALEGLKSATEGLGIAIAESGLLDFAAKIVRGLGEFVAGLAKTDPAILNTIVVLAGIAAAIGPVLVAIGTLGLALPALTAGFATLGITTVAALAPIVGIAAAVAAAGLLIYENWDRVSPIFTDIGRTLGEVFTAIKATFAGTGSALASIGITGARVGAALKAVGAVITDFIVLPFRLLAGALDIVVGEFKLLISVLTLDFKGAATGFSQIVDGIKLALFGIHKQTETSISSFFKLGTAVAATDESVTNAAASGGDLAASLAKVSIVAKASTKDLEAQTLALQKLNEGYDNVAIRSVLKVQDTPEFKLKLPDFASLPPALPLLDITPYTGPLQEATAQMALFQLTAETFSAGVGQAIEQALESTAAGVGEAIGQIALGAGGFELVGQALLAGIGSLAIQLGQLAIGAGIAVTGIKQALQSLNPAVAIAGGIALVALGTFVKGKAASIGGGGGGSSTPSIGGTGNSTRPSFTPTTAPNATAPGAGVTRVTHNVVFELTGNQLLAGIAIETDRLGRVVGRR